MLKLSEVIPETIPTCPLGSLLRKVFDNLPVIKSHILISLFLWPVARNFPSFLKTAVLTEKDPPVKTWITFRVSMLHNFTKLSLLPVASHFPSGVIRTAVSGPACSFSNAATGSCWLKSFKLHNMALLSLPAVAINWPSVLTLTDLILSECLKL